MRGGAVDTISNLPGNVVDHILSCLPLRDAVRTSTLSKEWRDKWLTMPQLVFDLNFEESLNGKHDTEIIINRTLGLHRGAITKFSVEVAGIKNHLAIDRWLVFLSDQPIEYLALLFSHSSDVMPVNLVPFDRLTQLYIENCEVKVPYGFKGFNRLAKLELVNVQMERGELELISKCPMLEFLNVQFLKGGLVQDFPIHLSHLTVLEFDEVDFGCLSHVISVLSLIRGSPNLQTMEIYCHSTVEEKPALQLLKAPPTCYFPLSSLEDVKIEMAGHAEEMEFVRVLLLWATALKELEIESVSNGATSEAENGCEMLRKLVSFRRSSPEAGIILKAKWFL